MEVREPPYHANIDNVVFVWRLISLIEFFMFVIERIVAEINACSCLLRRST